MMKSTHFWECYGRAGRLPPAARLTRRPSDPGSSPVLLTVRRIARGRLRQHAIGRKGANALAVGGSTVESSGQCRRMMLVMVFLSIQSRPSGE